MCDLIRAGTTLFFLRIRSILRHCYQYEKIGNPKIAYKDRIKSDEMPGTVQTGFYLPTMPTEHADNTCDLCGFVTMLISYP